VKRSSLEENPDVFLEFYFDFHIFFGNVDAPNRGRCYRVYDGGIEALNIRVD
jgi:hypothetical protein